MLETLSIKNFVIVDQLELNFKKGFSAFTGETGAGKSILIDALSICLGQRADISLIRKGKEKADISAIFNIDNNNQAKLWLKENEYEIEDSLLLRRIFSLDGKSKAFINGIPTSISQLKQLTNNLVDIYSQNSHHSLLNLSTQRDILDSYAQTKELSVKVREAFLSWSNLRNDYETFLKNKTAFISELEELQQKFSEYKELDFSVEKWEELQDRHKLLNNSNELIMGIQECINHLDGSENNSLNNQLHILKSSLTALIKLDKNLESKLSVVESSSIELLELSRDLNNYLSSIEVNEAERNDIESKIESTFNFLRKYKLNPDELMELSRQWEDRINDLNLLVNEKDKSEVLTKARENYNNVANKLSKQREITSKRLSDQITNKLKELSFKNAKFKVNLLNGDPSVNGNEQVEFLIATHFEADLRPIQKVASGGELSRISLAIRVSSMTEVDVPIMIFDEVDVGIGGGVAEIVGNLLKSLSNFNDRQIFVITHLPQVAAKSKYHFRVSKNTIAQETKSNIELLTNEERIKEIARMLGGLDITTTTLEHAKEILAN
jgi:DNA repair protein RecN (Recombination protein N)